MADFWVTFRLKNNPTYTKRYNALMAAFGEVGTNFWEEPTSFVAFESRYDISTIGGHLKKAIDPSVDIILLRQIGNTSTAYAGTPDDPVNFARYFPGAKKL